MTREWNLSDIAEHGPDSLLVLMRYRATNSLFKQYCSGVDGKAGDREFIIESKEANAIAHANPLPGWFTSFTDGQYYGKSFEIPSSDNRLPDYLKTAISADLITSSSIGDLILQRQSFFVQSLNYLIEDILNEVFDEQEQKEQTSQPKILAHATSQKPSQQAPFKPSISDLAQDALDQKTSFEEFLDMAWTEPLVIAQAVKNEFFTRPELLMDERGRRLPLHTDNHISPAFFQVIRKATEAAAIWDYASRLVTLLEDSRNKICRAIILQELSNICHLEYERTKSIFKRYIQAGAGSRYFCRRDGVREADGHERIVMKCRPETLIRTDPQLHHILHLCQTQTTASEAIKWLQMLFNLLQSHPSEWERIDRRELYALYDLIRVVEFIRKLSKAASMPPMSRKTGQTFIPRSHTLEIELDKLKDKLDLSKFAFPIAQLREASNASNALQTLDQLVVDATGATMTRLYQDLVDECLGNLQGHCQQVLNSARQGIEMPPAFATAVQHSIEAPAPKRKQKKKSRPSHSAVSKPESQPDTATFQKVASPQRLKVHLSTTKIFSNLFMKSQERSPVDWADFLAAMADIGFSVVPKYGSVFTFYPPDSMQVRRSLTLHRPHKSEIEGYATLIIARRLKRLYAWDEETFVAI